MKALNEIIKTRLNTALNITVSNHIYGLVIPVEKLKEEYYTEYDDADNKDVHIADNVDIVIYHRLMEPEQWTVTQDRGKKKSYNVVAKVDLVLYSRLFREAPDYVAGRLSVVKNLEIISRDFDSYKILRANTAKPDYNINHDLCIIRYELTYNSNECTDLILGDQIADCYLNTPDCND